MIRRRAVITGRVQGVGFRYSTAQRAADLGLTGYARNLFDGSVEVEVEGDEASVSEMLQWLASGPPTAAVKTVDVTDSTPRGESAFRVL
ncbi:acylphosphatase [Glaciihabitans sp. dw_435]|uniref:acylphosphatase n=1 Tax=Glaciihabitans sp. dw_435 TaxID=2720081 RepID=UPI001BD47070|nr:acylphosphatase [Glaciihabitans sp. dw_435]